MVIDYLGGLFSSDLGMDLGTANCLIYVKDKGIVLREPSVVAVERETGEVKAVGAKAKQMLGRTPANIVAVRPMKNGVIADFEVTQEMIRYFIRKVHSRSSLLRPRIVIGIPSDITGVERRAVDDAARQAGAREVYLIEEPMASAMGADLPIAEPHASMIVDIGGGTTEVAVISLGGMVVAKSIDVAGDELTECIVQYFRKKYSLIVGETTAEEVKINLGSVYPLKEERSMEVKGRDQTQGLPRTLTVTSEEIMASEENVSTASESMVVTTEAPGSLPIAETSQTATTVGVILAVCASLLICLGSAWLYRSRRLAGRNID
jgi:rod shape-determining protein MreB